MDEQTQASEQLSNNSSTQSEPTSSSQSAEQSSPSATVAQLEALLLSQQMLEQRVSDLEGFLQSLFPSRELKG